MTTQTRNPRNLPAPSAPQQDPRAVIEQLDRLSQEYGPQALAPLPMIARSMRLAEGVRQARALVHQVVPYLKHLAGTVLGFRTDKDDTGGYPDAGLGRRRRPRRAARRHGHPGPGHPDHERADAGADRRVGAAAEPAEVDSESEGGVRP